MKYKFTDKDGVIQEVNIPAEVLRKGKREGLTNKQTILQYIAGEGYNVDTPKIEQKPKVPKARNRKPDEQKREIINRVADVLIDLGAVDIINPERQIQVQINGETYELTMVKKRKK